MEMSFYAPFCPVCQLFFKKVPGALGLQTQGVATEINSIFPLMPGNMKTLPERKQYIGIVEITGKIYIRFEIIHRNIS